VEGSKCYNNQESNCDTYGRLYDWATAMNLPSGCNTSYCTSQIGAKHRGICPSGWHIPGDDEWETLTDFVGIAGGTKLKAASGWNSYSGIPQGTDAYGFSALPGGSGNFFGSSFDEVGYFGSWWSASECGSRAAACYRSMSYYSEGTSFNYYHKGYLFSVRCVQD